MMKPCCIESAKRYLKKNRDVATCDRCGFLLMAYSQQQDHEEALRSLKAWGGEFSTATLGRFQVIAKARSAGKQV
jgi:hypothetical protein